MAHVDEAGVRAAPALWWCEWTSTVAVGPRGEAGGRGVVEPLGVVDPRREGGALRGLRCKS